MLVIRQEQMDVFAPVALKSFERRMVAHLTGRFPEECKAMGDPKLKTRTQHYLGRCFLAKNMANLAVTQFTRALEGVSGVTDLAKEVLYHLGEAYEKMGEVRKAVETFEKIFESDIKYRDVSSKVTRLRQKLA